LREYNRQREKSFDERLREEVLAIDPAEAHKQLAIRRLMGSWLEVDELEIEGEKRRCRITAAKAPFLEALRLVINERRKFWPITARMCHYGLLNDPPLRHASKPSSRYANDNESYRSLIDLLIRARLTGQIPIEAIGDETRPVTTWKVHRTVGDFLSKEVSDFCTGYWRDLIQSQPNHIEIVCEKNTVEPIVGPVAGEFCIPLTSGRGYCSLPPRYGMAQRFRRSGKAQLVILIVSDFDPDGEEIAHSFAKSMRDDFHIEALCPIKVALTAEQVDEYDLPIGGRAKKGSSNYKKFVKRYDDDVVFELEALKPEALQQILRESIESVLDVDAFNHEQEQEQLDAAHLEGARRQVRSALQGMNLNRADEE
jgi:hypothetical protein